MCAQNHCYSVTADYFLISVPLSVFAEITIRNGPQNLWWYFLFCCGGGTGWSWPRNNKVSPKPAFSAILFQDKKSAVLKGLINRGYHQIRVFSKKCCFNGRRFIYFLNKEVRTRCTYQLI